MKKSIALICFFAFAIAAPGFAKAQTAAAPCDFSAQIKELRAVQTERGLSYLEKLRADAAIRRALLPEIIACDEREIAALRATLEGLPDDIKSLPAYGKIVEGLAGATRYYEERKRVIPSLSIQGLRDFPREIRAWRSETYAPLVTWADNFILWAGNQEFLDRASGRLAQVNRLALPLKLVSHEEINGRFEEARRNLETAFTENERARDFLNEGRAAEGLAHIQASLQAIANTYNIFFKIQEDLQDIIK